MELHVHVPRWAGLEKVISGGQTGADQGGLIAAEKLGVATGGTAPAGFMTSRGPAPLLASFGLVAKGTLQTRTHRNVEDSDGTVILSGDMSSPGTVLTLKLCSTVRRPVMTFDIAYACRTYGDTGGLLPDTINDMSEALHRFIMENRVSTLNVAGNRERYDDARTTWVTKIIVERALRLLDLDGMLVRDTDL